MLWQGVALALILVTSALEPVQDYNPGIQGKCDIWATTVYLLQLSSDTHSLTGLKERMNSWVGCKLTTKAGIQPRPMASWLGMLQH